LKSLFLIIEASYGVHPGADGLTANVFFQAKMVAELFQGFKPLSTAYSIGDVPCSG
jgi:hypothetical protein